MGTQAFGAARWNFAYSANDRTPFVMQWGRTTTTGAVVLEAKDLSFAVAASAGFTVGESVVAYDATGGEKIYFHVVGIADSTHLTLRPYTTASTTGSITQPFPYGNTLSSGTEIDNSVTTTSANHIMPHPAHALTIDLTDAPADETYTYLVMAAATTFSDTAAGQWTIHIRSQTEVDDALSAFGTHTAYHQATYRQEVASVLNGDRYPYNAAFIETLTPGNRWTFNMETWLRDSGHIVQLENMRLTALRIDTTHEHFQVAGTGGVNQDITTDATNVAQDSVQVTVGSGHNNSDEVFVVACALIGNTATGDTNVNLDVNGANVSSVRRTFNDTIDLNSVGFNSLEDGFSSGETITWEITGVTGTGVIESPFIAFIPLDAIHGVEAYNPQRTINPSSAPTEDFAAGEGSAYTYTGATALEEGRHLVFVNYEGKGDGTDERGYGRPRYSTDPPHIYEGNRTPRGWCGIDHLRGAGASVSTFWFHRIETTGGDVTVGVAHRIPVGDDSDMSDQNVYTFALRERANVDPNYTDEITVAAELETGAVFENWNSIGSDQYERDLPDVVRVSSVKVNADAYTKQTTLGSIAAQEWHWDMDTRKLTIQMDTGDAPTDGDRVVLVRWQLLFARDHVGLTHSDDEDMQYEPRLATVPQYSQTLQMTEGVVEVTSSVGELEIVAGDDAFDHIPSQELIQGSRVTVLKGSAAVSVEREDYDVVIAATASEPRLSRESLSVTLFGQHIELERPINKTHITVYEADQTREDQVSPKIYGAAFRAPAYRLTDVTTSGGTNSYKIADHAIEDIIAVFEDADDPRTAVTTYTEDLPNGEVDIVNQDLPEWAKLITDGETIPDNAPDVVYVNCVGYAETIAGVSVPVETPGRIVRHLLTTHAGLTDFDEYALRAIDMRWRRRMDISTDPYERLYRPPTLGLYIDADQTVGDVLAEVSAAGGFYIMELRSGRISVGVTELSSRNVLGNSGFENDASASWPWHTAGGATFATTTGKVFQGARAAVVSSGARGTLGQAIDFHRTGWWVASIMLALEEGDGSAFRIAVVQPGDGFNYTMSDPFEITSTEWKRVNLPIELAAGNAGRGELVLIPFLPEAASPEMTVTSDLLCWLKADAMVTDGDASADGDAVATWSDQSGNGNDYAQGTGASQPTYRNNVRAGHPAVWFDRADDILAVSGAFAVSQPYTISVVCAFVDDGADLGGTSRYRNVLRNSGANTIVFGLRSLYYGVYNAADQIVSTDTVESGRFVVLTYVVDGSGCELFLDGVSQGTDTNNDDWNDMQMSGADTDGQAMAFVGELLVWDKDLSTAEREAAEDYLFSKWGIRDVSVNIDNAWMLPVAAPVETVGGDDGEPALNFAIEESEVRPDVFYEAELPYNPFISGSVPTPTRWMTDSEARGLIATYDSTASEARTAIATSKRIFLEDAVITNEVADEARESASGIAADIATNFSRMRTVLRGRLQGVQRAPNVGEVLFHPPTLHIPAAASAFPFWLLTMVGDVDAATEFSIEAEREIDPVKDRAEIASLAFPTGALGVSLTDAAITGYDIVTGPQNKYLKAVSSSPNLSASLGNHTHKHWLPHTHVLPAHTHTWVGTVGASNDNSYFNDNGTYQYPSAELEGISYTYPSLATLGFDTVVPTARGFSDGDHTHTAPGAVTSGAASSAVSANTTTTFVHSGVSSTELKNIRVTLRRRTGEDDEIPTTIIVGYIGDTAPSGWSRETTLDGYYLRGSTEVTATATTLTTTWAASDNSVMSVASTTDIMVGTRLTLVDSASGGHTTHVTVSTVTALLVLVVRLAGETGDDNAHSYATATTTVTPTAETVGATFTPATHDHYDEVEDHTHAAAHSHAIAQGTSGASTPQVDTTCAISSSSNAPQVDYDSHTHEVKAVLDSSTPTSSSAGGGTINSKTYVQDTYELLFIKPSAGGVEQLPTNTVLLFDGTTPPGGWEILTDAAGKFLKAAETGVGPVGGSVATHVHTWTSAAHTLSHTHASASSVGSGRAWYHDTDSGFRPYTVAGPIHAPDMWVASEGYARSDIHVGHAHFATIGSVSTTDPGLSAAAGIGSFWETGDPYHATVVLIRKL